jgi:hypothetical protein
MGMHIDDVSPRDDNTISIFNRDYQSVSGKALCCALAADGGRAYLGGHSGVWRSDDGGDTWRHLEWPQPPAGSTSVSGALVVTTIYDLLISPANPDIVLAAAGRDGRRPDQSGIWRSADGGATWRRVHVFTRNGVVEIASCLAVAPDDPAVMFAAGGFAVARSTNGGVTWTESVPPFQNLWERVRYITCGPLEGRRRRRVYAAGNGLWYSRDGAVSWTLDPMPFALGAPADGPGFCARSIGIHPQNPRRLYVSTFERNDAIDNTEGIVWRGEYPPIDSDGPGAWMRLAPMLLGFGGTTASGTGFVVPHVAPNGEFYLLASDRRTVQSCVGEAALSSDWIRIEDVNCHLDPHGLALTPDFRRQLPFGPKVADAGRILLVNDGGANVSTTGAMSWTNGTGLSTLGIVNVAVAPQPEGGPAVCMGMGDNSGYASPDGGLSWKTQAYLGGDNDCAFADPRQRSRVIVFAPRDGKGNEEQGVGRGVIHLYVNPQGAAPDTAHGTPHLQRIPGAPPLASDIIEALNSDDPVGALNRLNAAWSVVSWFYNLGYRPLVMTPRGEAPAPDGDFVVIRFSDDGPELVRTLQMSTITTAEHWRTGQTSDGPGVHAFQQGPPLPDPAICIVQASGGHRAPVFYVGDQDTESPRNGRQRLWKWTEGMDAWQQLVPPPGAPSAQAPVKALRYYVDPYRPNLLYVVGLTHVHRSDNGGATWMVDQSLERAVTNDYVFPFASVYDGNPGQALIRDMLFDPDRPGARFAVGPAGVFHTLDGVTWTHLILSEATAMRPNNAAYDFVSCPRALYVATSNRGLLRVSPLPPDWDYPLQTLQGAEGRITMLRVHDLGTAYGPPDDRIDAEVIIWLDTEPDKAFGFQLRDDANRPAADGMLSLLRDSFNRGRSVRIDFSRSSCRTGRIIRVIER